MVFSVIFVWEKITKKFECDNILFVTIYDIELPSIKAHENNLSLF